MNSTTKRCSLKTLVLALLFLGSTSGFAADALRAPWLKVSTGSTPIAYKHEKKPSVVLQVYEYPDDKEPGPTEKELAEYVEKQDLVRSWANRVVGIRDFYFQSSKRLPNGDVELAGQYKKDEKIVLFRERHVFGKSFKQIQLSYPEKALTAKEGDELWLTSSANF